MNHSTLLQFATLCACIVLSVASDAHARRFDFKDSRTDFSLDPASPEVPTFSAASILYSSPTSFPPVQKISHAHLGLLAGEDVTSFSYGFDHSLVPNSSIVRTAFSVTRNSVGVAGSVIAAQVGANGVASDTYVLTTSGFPPVPTALTYVIDALGLGLQTGAGGGQSNVDGWDIHQNAVFGNQFKYRRVYFCVDAAAAARLTIAMSTPVTQGTVLIQTAPTNPLPSVYATPAQLGLVAGDVIDALAVLDHDAGLLNGGDLVYISLAPGSPSAAALGTASIIEVGPAVLATPIVRLTPANLSLLPTDDVDAITIYDPCPADVFPAAPQGGNGTVTVDDLLSVINQWGQCPAAPCSADIDGNEWVNVDDLLALFVAPAAPWGMPCP